MDVIARRAFERPDVEANRAGVTRANMVRVWHMGQSGRRMVMMLSPLVQAGALQNSQSPVDTEGGGDGASMELPLSRRWSILLTFEKLITRSAPDCGLSQRPGDAVRTPIARPMVGSA